jgi:hypothetical protein
MMFLRFGGTWKLHLHWTVEAAGSTKRLLCIYQIARRRIPADIKHTYLRRTLETCPDMDGGGCKTVHLLRLHEQVSGYPSHGSKV